VGQGSFRDIDIELPSDGATALVRDVSGPTSANTTAARPSNTLSAALTKLCDELAAGPPFNGEVGEAVLTYTGGDRVGCMLELRAASTALADLDLHVDALCPPNASLLLGFTVALDGSWSFDPDATSRLDNAGCL
jgi:hypothetical protein